MTVPWKVASVVCPAVESKSSSIDAAELPSPAGAVQVRVPDPPLAVPIAVWQLIDGDRNNRNAFACVHVGPGAHSERRAEREGMTLRDSQLQAGRRLQDPGRAVAHLRWLRRANDERSGGDGRARTAGVDRRDRARIGPADSQVVGDDRAHQQQRGVRACRRSTKHRAPGSSRWGCHRCSQGVTEGQDDVRS